LELENNRVEFSRKERFNTRYIGSLLPHYYFAYFVIENKIIIEINAVEPLICSQLKQTLIYLAASKFKLGLLINFGEETYLIKKYFMILIYVNQ